MGSTAEVVREGHERRELMNTSCRKGLEQVSTGAPRLGVKSLAPGYTTPW